MNQRPVLGSLPKTSSFRGQPLALMLAVLALWIGSRASLWAPPLQSENLVHLERGAGRVEPVAREETLELYVQAGSLQTMATAVTAPSQERRREVAAAQTALQSWLSASGPLRHEPLERDIHAPLHADAAAPGSAPQSRPSEFAPIRRQPVEFPLARPAGSAAGPNRLSSDAWLFVRAGGAANTGAGPLVPTYGRSQFGAVLRYDLGARVAYRPQAYLRATGAFDSREADLAAGISIQPLPALPLRAHGEVRLSRLGGRVEARPSAFITAGIEENLQPLEARIRGYAQAGYVGGEFATAFVDGSLVVERDVSRFERGAFAIGVGAWGGAQEGTARLDAGPTASANVRVGQGVIRLAADYRIRVAGVAEPASGAALTLSTSF